MSRCAAIAAGSSVYLLASDVQSLLEAQLSDPNSALNEGTYTSNVDASVGVTATNTKVDVCADGSWPVNGVCQTNGGNTNAGSSSGGSSGLAALAVLALIPVAAVAYYCVRRNRNKSAADNNKLQQHSSFPSFPDLAPAAAPSPALRLQQPIAASSPSGAVAASQPVLADQHEGGKVRSHSHCVA